jgi:hypothetical protein
MAAETLCTTNMTTGHDNIPQESMSLRRIPLVLLCCMLFATEPNDATRRWWSHVQALANDDLAGRDTGSEGYRRASRYVAAQFEKAGLKPAGENGYYQSVPFHAVRLRTDQSSIELVRDGGVKKLQWLGQVTTAARENLPARIEAPLVFAAEAASDDLEGAIVVQLGGGGRGGRGTGGGVAPGAAGTLTIDSTAGPEPPRWPVAYSVAMSVSGMPRQQAQQETGRVAFRFNPAFAEELFEGSGHTYKELLELAAQKRALPHFALGAVLRATMKVETADIQSDNIVAALPGSDPALANEYVVVSAHLDGYGIGEPWNGDRIYNGAFDDAAYVATLIDFAQRLQESHMKLRRSLLFLIVTGEEKGLLGSRYFAAHPAVAKERMVANVNLDQLRPIFPLKTLTTLAVDESSMGDTVRKVAEPMGIRIQPDLEPERRLLTRSDHYSFMQIGVPAVGFIFGYEKGSPEEMIYRRWYAERYHSPADDLNQPWDPPAAAKFNEFFARVVEALANADARPKWKAGSSFAK